MSIRDLEQSKEMRLAFKALGGREGVSKRAIEICKRVAESGCPRMAVFAIGRMARLFQICQADEYWAEKSRDGKDLEFYAVKQAVKNSGVFDSHDSRGDEKR